ncbi:DEAD/DEAH box helicase family protein [Limosilactobacillus reuteri]|uniref:restriction endonuclease n=1 Tax=Limosilactobacillus reuteri TaxID=1598 RepID=UPI002FEE9DD7
MAINMKINYEKLPYQHKAVKAVVDTLSGHDDLTNKIVLKPDLLDDSVQITLLNNGQKYHGTNYLKPFPQFNIEMETGTGKTMVYLQTIMALHKRFHENKFVIVVPSRAIKAGVEDNLNNLRDYLSDIYNTDKYHHFVYDSKQISELHNFVGSNFEIMLTTVQSFNKSTNVINQEYSEGFFGGKPLDQIRNARPIVIIDEPQSVDSAKAGKKAIASLNPKVALRYSATHRERQYPLLYEFGPAQAYKVHMVKHIETLGTEINTNGNVGFVQLKDKPTLVGDSLQAKVIAYKQVSDDYEKKTITLHQNDSLFEKTKNPQYQSWGRVVEINRADDFVEFENGRQAILGEHEGESQIWIQSQMKALIKDHLNRELAMQDQGIKVLSLIFLDEVKNYRIYTEDGPKKGQYADLFERIYERVLHSNPKYKKLYNYSVPVEEIHDGYFAQDKATRKKPAMYRDTKGDTKKDETAYEAIMQDKEGLLTQYIPGKPETDTKAAKLRFIFTHSALKEGWDNPNVFQILSITTPKNDLTRRQKIGRGLRIPVNQQGKRVYNDKQNVVTIYANETFSQFAEGLQNEYLHSGLFENKIDANFFTNLIVKKQRFSNALDNSTEYDTDNSQLQSVDASEGDQNHSDNRPISKEESQTFVSILKKNNIIQDNGKPLIKGLRKLNNGSKKQNIINQALKEGLDKQPVNAMIDNVLIKFDVPKPTNRRQRMNVNLTDTGNPYLNDLWNKIAYKVHYHVRFNENRLIEEIVNGDNAITDIRFKKMTAIQTRARMEMLENKIDSEIVMQDTEHLIWPELPIIDITKQIADRVGLTRQAVIKIILQAEEKDDDFLNKIKMNPSLFVQRAVKNIQAHEQKLLNRSLVYVQSGESWSKHLLKPFSANKDTLWEVPKRGLQKTLFDRIATQSEEENKFAKSLVNEEKIKYFLKLPNWFKIPTPFGNYIPDWAILAETNGAERLYFVIDTKSNVEMSKLRDEERNRIFAGRQAYKAKGFEDVQFDAPVQVIGDLDI